VSSDGARVLFISPQEGSSARQLYMRKNGTSTVWLSRSWNSTPDPEPAGVLFQAASADDTKVLFTSKSRLLNSDTGEGELGIYLYTDSEQDAESEGKLKLIARVNGPDDRNAVAGMSDDATHIYFFSRPTSAIPREGEYLWDNGTLHFVAAVSSGVGPLALGPEEPGNGARVSSDGRRLAFLRQPNPQREPEVAKPAPNQDDSNGYRALYLYDEGTEKLACVSCPPDGGAVTSNAVIASRITNASAVGIGGAQFPQRYLSSDGRYVFFTTAQSLVPQDSNGLADVYEYDADTGRLSLISSGTGEGGSWFEDASADGSNVFFLTAQKLTGWDTDTLTDLYDARVDGGFPEPVPPPVPCDGDACQGVPSAVPSFNTASGFVGLGNVHPEATTVKKKSKPKKHSVRHRGKKHKGHAGKARKSGVRKPNRAGR
jgi:dipeptidyl aminopeptidase/acylaminoacyl peptidase